MMRLFLCIWISIGCLEGVLAQHIQIVGFRATNEYEDSIYRLEKPIVLDFRQTHIQITFQDASDSLNARYAYHLVGLDRRWQAIGRSQSVNFVNLLGGSYELQVKNLNYTDKIASLKFHLEVAFWQKPWFIPMIGGYVLLILSIIFYFLRIYKLRSVLHLQQVRNEIAADLHDDVGSTLGNIHFLGEMAKMKFEKNPADALPILERIIENSKEMIQTMRGMVWTINPDNDKAIDFLEKVRAFAEAMLTNRSISLQFKNEVPENQLLTIEQQRNLFLVFKEMIHNIAKHSQAKNVNILLKKHENWLWAKVTDDGVGFDTSEISEGNGLRNLQKRIEQLEGKIEITSEAGKGTRIKLMLPL